MRLRIQQKPGGVERLLDPISPTNHFGLRKRPPGDKLAATRIDLKQRTNVVISQFSEVSISRGIAVGQPILADAGLQVMADDTGKSVIGHSIITGHSRRSRQIISLGQQGGAMPG